MCGENHVPTVAPVAAKTPTSNAKAFGDNGRHMRTPSPMAMPLAIPVATQGRNACGENKLNNNMTTMTARKALTNALLEATRIRTPISLYLTPELSRPTKRCRLERTVRPAWCIQAARPASKMHATAKQPGDWLPTQCAVRWCRASSAPHAVRHLSSEEIREDGSATHLDCRLDRCAGEWRFLHTRRHSA